MERPGPRVKTPGRVATSAAIRPSRIGAVEASPPFPAAPRVQCAVGPVEAEALARPSMAQEGARPPAALPTAAVPFPPVPAATVAAPQGLVPEVAPTVASIKETVPDGKGHEAMPPSLVGATRTTTAVKRAGVVLKKGRPEERRRPFLAPLVGGLGVVAPSATSARRRPRAPVEVGVPGLPTAAFPWHETARGVPEVPTKPAPMATVAPPGTPPAVGLAPAGTPRPKARGALVVVPSVARTATAAVAASGATSSTCLGAALAGMAEVDPIPFRAPREPIREAAAAAIGAATALALAPVARVRRAAPAVVAASAPASSSAVAAAAEARPRLEVP